MTMVERPRLIGREPGRWGEVKGINAERRRVAIITDWGYAVATLRAGVLRVGDPVLGEVESMGVTTLRNLRTREPVTLEITHVQVTMVLAATLLES
ncbi:MAG TPA: hypothetical protein VGE57_00650 [Solimonas sp.]